MDSKSRVMWKRDVNKRQELVRCEGVLHVQTCVVGLQSKDASCLLYGCHIQAIAIDTMFEESKEPCSYTLVLVRSKPAGQSATAPAAVRRLFPQQPELCCLRSQNVRTMKSCC